MKEFMEVLIISAGVIGIVVDIPLCLGIWKNQIRQNFVTYFLWGLLDTIVFVTIFLQGGNIWLPLGYAIGSLIVATFLLIKKQFSWTWVETLVVVLIIICLFIWWKEGARAATIASVAALGIASIPQIVETWKDPDGTPTNIYLVFTLAGLLSFIGGASWTIEDKLYPGAAFILSLLIALMSTRETKKESISI